MTSDHQARGFSDNTAAGEALVAEYPGAAFLMRTDGSLIVANAKAADTTALLESGAVPDLRNLILRAGEALTVTSASLSLPGNSGDVLAEATVAPVDGGAALLVLLRDRTLEYNLRAALIESRQRFKDLVDVSSDFAWEVGANGTFAYVSPKGALGYPAGDLVGRRPRDFVIDPEEYSPLPFACDHPLDDVEMWMRRADGSTACVVASCLPLTTEEGKRVGARGVCRDVTLEREREAALARARHREQLLSYVVSTIRDEVEPHNMLTAAAAATGRSLGAAGCRIYRRQESGVFSVAAEYGNATGLGKLETMLEGYGSEEGTFELTSGKWQVLATNTNYRHTINGAICMWKPTAAEDWDDDSRILISDVANQLGIANEQIIIHERIVRLSRTDGLTGLLNRRAFYEEELPRRMRRLERSGETAALFYLDLDNFKAVNDTFGHQRGDEALLFLRDMLLENSRPGDVIARLGGDEFAVWLDGIAPEATMRRARAMIEAGRELKQFSGESTHPLGISIGVATHDPADGESLDQLLARADAAMYVVKNRGKGGIEMAPPLRVSRSGGAGDAAKREDSA